MPRSPVMYKYFIIFNRAVAELLSICRIFMEAYIHRKFYRGVKFFPLYTGRQIHFFSLFVSPTMISLTPANKRGYIELRNYCAFATAHVAQTPSRNTCCSY